MVYTNNKTKEVYRVIGKPLINTTNAQDGQRMIMYRNVHGKDFVRKASEFHEKFTKKEQ